MSVTRFRLCLAVLGVLALGIIGASIVPTLLAERNGWDIFSAVPEEMEDVDLLIAQPNDLLTARDRGSIRSVVAEARRFGIPWSVAVVRDTELDGGVDPAEYAEMLYSERGIESREGADDGLLMAVFIPEDDHTGTTVHFVAGDAFYPKGGITPERLQWIADVQMAPMIADNTIGDAIIEGATWVEWMQLFEPTPNPPAINSESAILHPLGSVALGGLTIAIAGAAIVIAVLTRRGTISAESIELDTVGATALAIGRVNQQVVAGIVLDAIDRGVLIDAPDGLTLASNVDEREGRTYDGNIAQAMTEFTQRAITVPPARLVRYLRNAELPRVIEDDLAGRGLVHPRSPLYELTLRITALTGLLMGLIGVALAVIGEVGSTLALAFLLTAVSVAVLIWNEFRPWTTRAGQAALDQWLLHHQESDDRDRQVYDTIRRLDDVESRMVALRATDSPPPTAIESLRPQS